MADKKFLTIKPGRPDIRNYEIYFKDFAAAIASCSGISVAAFKKMLIARGFIEDSAGNLYHPAHWEHKSIDLPKRPLTDMARRWFKNPLASH